MRKRGEADRSPIMVRTLMRSQLNITQMKHILSYTPLVIWCVWKLRHRWEIRPLHGINLYGRTGVFAKAHCAKHHPTHPLLKGCVDRDRRGCMHGSNHTNGTTKWRQRNHCSDHL